MVSDMYKKNLPKLIAAGNATTNDLWSALSKVSGQDVNQYMDNWIRKIGFPVLTVAEEPGQITVKQQRFLSTGDVGTEDDKTTWWIPLGLKEASGAVKSTALTGKGDTVRGIEESFYKLNANTAGFTAQIIPLTGSSNWARPVTS